MEIFDIIFASIIATTIMTGFSHLAGALSGHRFNEAHLLNRFMRKSEGYPSDMGKNNYRGWAIHYLIGVVMATGLWVFFHLTNIGTGLILGTMLGFGAGCVGLGGWYLMFLLHNNPPKVDLQAFFFQLLAAHMIFGAVVFGIFKLLHGSG